MQGSEDVKARVGGSASASSGGAAGGAGSHTPAMGGAGESSVEKPVSRELAGLSYDSFTRVFIDAKPYTEASFTVNSRPSSFYSQNVFYIGSSTEITKSTVANLTGSGTLPAGVTVTASGSYSASEHTTQTYNYVVFSFTRGYKEHSAPGQDKLVLQDDARRKSPKQFQDAYRDSYVNRATYGVKLNVIVDVKTLANRRTTAASFSFSALFGGKAEGKADKKEERVHIAESSGFIIESMGVPLDLSLVRQLVDQFDPDTIITKLSDVASHAEAYHPISFNVQAHAPENHRFISKVNALLDRIDRLSFIVAQYGGVLNESSPHIVASKLLSSFGDTRAYERAVLTLQAELNSQSARLNELKQQLQAISLGDDAAYTALVSSLDEMQRNLERGELFGQIRDFMSQAMTVGEVSITKPGAQALAFRLADSFGNDVSHESGEAYDRLTEKYKPSLSIEVVDAAGKAVNWPHGLTVTLENHSELGWAATGYVYGAGTYSHRLDQNFRKNRFRVANAYRLNISGAEAAYSDERPLLLRLSLAPSVQALAQIVSPKTPQADAMALFKHFSKAPVLEIDQAVVASH